MEPSPVYLGKLEKYKNNYLKFFETRFVLVKKTRLDDDQSEKEASQASIGPKIEYLQPNSSDKHALAFLKRMTIEPL